MMNGRAGVAGSPGRLHYLNTFPTVRMTLMVCGSQLVLQGSYFLTGRLYYFKHWIETAGTVLHSDAINVGSGRVFASTFRVSSQSSSLPDISCWGSVSRTARIRLLSFPLSLLPSPLRTIPQLCLYRSRLRVICIITLLWKDQSRSAVAFPFWMKELCLLMSPYLTLSSCVV